MFSWYAANFGKFNETYGSLGAAIGFMTWLWITAIMVLLGAELDAEWNIKRRMISRPANRNRWGPAAHGWRILRRSAGKLICHRTATAEW